MSTGALWRGFWRISPWVALLVLLATSLYLMSVATQDATRFGEYYTWLLVFNGIALVLLLAVIAQQTIRLYRHLRRRTPGARLTRRFVLVFLGLVAPPVIVVYLFSLQLLHRGMDSWFDVQVEQALRSALTLSQLYLDENKRDLVAATSRAAVALRDVPEARAPARLIQWLQQTDATELTLFTTAGGIVATASRDPSDFVPDYPEDVILLIARQRDFYAALEPAGGDELKMRVLINLNNPAPFATDRLLQAIFEVPEDLGNLAEGIAEQYARYQTLAYLREPLKISFTITLSLVLLLSLLLAMVMAFRAARRLVAPIRSLSEATEDIAAGHYGRQLSTPGEDELGFLVRSFNTMTEELDRSTRSAERNRRQVESQRAYLQAVLARLSSGVLTVDGEHCLLTANQAAGEILGFPAERAEGQNLQALGEAHPQLVPLLTVIEEALHEDRSDWREQLVLFGRRGRQVLMCRGTRLATGGGGQVVVFDDLTAVIQAQRDTAWGEMAKRLAHEVKNPLTPIQLSAERIRHRFLHHFSGAEADRLDRATHTIVQQVEALKKLINAFGEYARAPDLQLESVSLNELIEQVTELYAGDAPGFHIELELENALPPLQADADRLRQLLHNLIINAQEAIGDDRTRRLTIVTRHADQSGHSYLEMTFTDSGRGFPEDLLQTLFEPYTTTKPKGSGLGLAIVRKIVEEHHGMIHAENMNTGGARVVVRLPIQSRH